jgi:hypothetical protein
MVIVAPGLERLITPDIVVCCNKWRLIQAYLDSSLVCIPEQLRRTALLIK